MHLLQLIRGSTIHILGNGPDYHTTEYVPLEPSASLAEITDAIQRGADNDITVDETLEILVLGATAQIVQANVQRLRSLLAEAERAHRHNKGEPVYIELQVDGEIHRYRSQILRGRMELDGDAMRTIAGNKVEARLHITRRFFWERSTEAEVRMTSFTQSAAGTGGRTVRNHTNNTTQANWVDIGAGEIIGAVPAPARIELRNTNNASRSYTNIYVGCEVMTGPQHFSYLVQGEDAMAAGPGEAQSDMAGNSNSSVYGMTVQGIARPRWQYAAPAIQAASGQTYRIFVRFNWYTFVPGNTIFVTPQIMELAGAADLNPYGVELALPMPQRTLVDVGSVTFGDFPAAAPLSLALLFRSAASVLVEIDFYQPLPADNMRHLTMFKLGIAPNEVIVDDGMTGRMYVQTTAGQQLPVVGGKGRPIMLWPNTGYSHRIYVMQEQNGQMPIQDTFSVRVYYRPRRLTI